jgi:hypothetical protein
VLSNLLYRPAHENIRDRASGGHSKNREAGDGTSRVRSAACFVVRVFRYGNSRPKSMASAVVGRVSASPVGLARKEGGLTRQ